MSNNKKEAFSPIYFLHDGIDTIIEEKGDSFTAIRKVQWGKEGTLSDSTKGKIEIRRWRVDGSNETPNKGLVFMTEEGPHNCVTGLIECGFGHTKDILLKLKERDDFRDSVEHMYDESETSDSNGEYFDARELLLND